MFDNIGTTEIIVVAVILLIFFGGKKLPEFGHSLGVAIKELKNAFREEEQNKKGRKK